MKKKKYLLVSLITIVCIFIFTVIITSVNKRRTVDDLMSQLEKAVNNQDINSIVKLYPDYYRDTLTNILSKSKLEDFHDNVGDIDINVVWNNDKDSESMSSKIETEIKTDYNVDVKIQDTQLITISYNKNFGESNFYVIKIQNEYYIYSDSVLPEPIQYFVE